MVRLNFGDRLPTDLDDTKPSPAVQADSLSGELFVGPFTNCCAEIQRRLASAEKLIKSAEDQAKDALEQARKGSPTPGDNCGPPAGYNGYWFNVRLTYANPSCVGSPYQHRFVGLKCIQGARGTVNGLNYERCELYTFNSRRASEQFQQQKFAESTANDLNEQFIVGQEDLWKVNAGNSGYQGDPLSQPPEIEPPSPGIINVCQVPPGRCQDFL